MTITIDAAGRVVIPQAVRRRLGLEAGTKFDIEEIDGSIVLRPTSLVQIDIAADGLPILRATGPGHMSTEDVRKVIEETREWPRH